MCFALFTFSFCFGQQDFNAYKSLRSEGAVPADFSTPVSQKVQQDLNTENHGMTPANAKKFSQKVHFEVDNMLHSGMVIYGDEVSVYVRGVADKLLANDPALRTSLRFYTIKSSASNAFSTDQGIVFVTTGLISQLTNEAQLAYVLAHEIAHYTEKHVVETFELTSGPGVQKKNIRDLSIYSKEKEFEADKIGLKLYHAAGYDPDQLEPVFNVLMYSYLPFEEVEFPISYFNTAEMYVPALVFPKEKFPIQAVEDYDDAKSSHPNIKKRKDRMEEAAEAYTGWGDSSFLLGEARFMYVRNLCRFESVRTHLIEGEYIAAFYAVFILEQDFPGSLYLKRMKAQAWLGIVNKKIDGKIPLNSSKSSELEGEIATFEYMIRKLNKDALITLALRQVYDAHLQFPEDPEIQAIYKHFLTHIVASKQFHENIYFPLNLDAAVKAWQEQKYKPVVADSVATGVSQPAKTLSKYEKIEARRKGASKSGIPEANKEIDSAKFYCYGIPDILRDSVFNATVKTLRKKNNEREETKDSLQLSTGPVQYEQELYQDLHTLIVVEPLVFSYQHTDFNMERSEALKQKITKAMTASAGESSVNTHLLSRAQLTEEAGTAIFNEKNILFTYLFQAAESNDAVFPVDYLALQEIQQKYQTPSILFTLVEHKFKSMGPAFILTPVFPLSSFLLPILMRHRHNTELNLLVLDLHTAEIDLKYNYTFRDNPNKQHNLGAHLYHIFQCLSAKPINQ